MPNSVPTNIQYEWHGLITENVKMLRKKMKEDDIIKNTYAVFLRAVFLSTRDLMEMKTDYWSTF